MEPSLFFGTQCLVRRISAQLLAFRAQIVLLAVSCLLSWAEVRADWPPLRITEFMASNGSTFADEDGDQSDWIEIHNPNPEAVSLADWYLTDNDGNLTKWRFEGGVIEGGGYRIVFASGKDRRDGEGEMHTNFSLSADGEFLALVAPDGITVVDSFDPAYPGQFRDVSYGWAQEVSIRSLIGRQHNLQWTYPAVEELASGWRDPATEVAGWQSGVNGVGYQMSQSGFHVNLVTSAIPITSLALAEIVLALPAFQIETRAEVAPVINYFSTGGEGHYPENRAFPGITIGEDQDDFVVHARAIVSIPTSGAWTFGVNSDDGFRLRVGANQSSFPNPRGPATTIGFFVLPAGDHELELTYFERDGGASVELFAAEGFHAIFSEDRFHLVGDTSGGGLAVRTPADVGVTGGDFGGLIGTDLGETMRGMHPGVLIRYPFTVTDPEGYDPLTFRVHYKDGFAAYLNGELIARRNAPENLDASSLALTARAPNLPLLGEELLIDASSLLRAGNNVLAVHALNAAEDDNAFLFHAELVERRVEGEVLDYLGEATPGRSNTPGTIEFTEAPEFSHAHGFYDAPFDLVITGAVPGTMIRYSTNGRPPTGLNGQIYTQPLRIDKTTVLRVMASVSGAEPSPVVTQSYFFLGDVVLQSANRQAPPGFPSSWGANEVNYGMDPNIVNHAIYGPQMKDALLALPSFSIVMDLDDLFGSSRGIYANPWADGRDWERPASLELIHPDGEEGFQIPCGIRLRGGFSRSTSNPKHAFRFFFRGEYGVANLRYPLFGDRGASVFDKIDLRTFQNYSWSFQGDQRGVFLRDQLGRDLQEATGQPATRGEYYHLYINGQYWGIFNTQERAEASFASTYFGGREEDYDVIKVEAGPYEIYATDGNTVAWRTLWELAGQDLTSTERYQRLLGNNPDGTANPEYPVLVDPLNLIDYMLNIFYGGNLDAPISNFLGNSRPNNFYAIRNRTIEARQGFKFFVHDAEHTLLGVTENRLGPFPAGSEFQYSNPQWLFQRLIGNAEFRMMFADRVQKHCFNGGALSTNSVTRLLDRRADQLRLPVIAESARWGDAKRSPALNQANWEFEIQRLRTVYVPRRTDILIAHLRSRSWYPQLSAPTMTPFGGILHGTETVFLELVAPASGEIYFTTNGEDPRLPGGNVSESATLYEAAFALQTHATVKARVKNGDTWSALVESPFVVDPGWDSGTLIVSELMYHPSDSPGRDGDEYEFIELKNAGSEVLDLSDASFADGIEFKFPAGFLLNPGAFAVLVRNPDAFEERYPGVTISGVYSGALSNSGERLVFVHASGRVVFDFEYSDQNPWPNEADGDGYSLVPMNPMDHADPGDSASWRISGKQNGSPGADEATEPLETFEEWAERYFSAEELENPELGGIDSDEDGRTNQEEYLAGTHPKNSVSYLALQVSHEGTSVGVRVETQAGRLYRIEFQEVLGGEWKVLSTHRAGSTTGVWDIDVLTDFGAGNGVGVDGQGYYRVQVGW